MSTPTKIANRGDISNWFRLKVYRSDLYKTYAYWCRDNLDPSVYYIDRTPLFSALLDKDGIPENGYYEFYFKNLADASMMRLNT